MKAQTHNSKIYVNYRFSADCEGYSSQQRDGMRREGSFKRYIIGRKAKMFESGFGGLMN
jgi:hypothetical protein